MSGISVAGIVFVISGPSGVGKSSMLRRVLEFDRRLRFSVSHTTRPPRADESDGEHYHFVSAEDFRAMIEQGAFLEWAEYQGNLYGTSRSAVDEPTGQGIDLILEVEVQGARQLRSRLPEAVTIFVLPPGSLHDLEERLRSRRSDDEQAIRKRLETARKEVQEAEQYDYVIVNDELDRASADLLHVVGAARLRREHVLPGWKAGFELD